MKYALFFLVLSFAISAKAQLPTGSIAPDFELTDLNGDSHHLYQYLDEGKVVFIQFFACHCPSCWAYFNTGTLESVYQNYGPSGTDQVRVLMLEHDEYNSDAFYGQGGYTQGNWVAGTTIPMIDVEGADRTVFDDYNMSYYPMIMKVCPDKTVEQMYTNYSVAELYQEADDCPGTLGIEQVASDIKEPYINQHRQLVIDGAINRVELTNAQGQVVISTTTISGEGIPMMGNQPGVYFVYLERASGTTVHRLYIH